MLHELVRRGWPGLASQQALPKHLEAEVRRYRGFVQVECEDCGATRLVAFSCKGRGWCPSCAAKRALESATHLEEVLPRVGYRLGFEGRLGVFAPNARLRPHVMQPSPPPPSSEASACDTTAEAEAASPRLGHGALCLPRVSPSLTTPQLRPAGPEPLHHAVKMVTESAPCSR